MILCQICHEDFQSTSNYINHLNTHNLENFSCSVLNCKRKFSYLESYKSHLMRHHSDKSDVSSSQTSNFDITNFSVTDLSVPNRFNTNTEHLVENTYDFENIVKRDILKLIVQVYNENSISRKKMLEILNLNFSIFKTHINHIFLKTNSNNDEISQYLQILHDSCTIGSEYLIFKELHAAGYLMYPVTHLIKSNIQLSNKNCEINTKQNKITIEMIDLLDLFSKLFTTTNMLNDIISNIEQLQNSRNLFVINYMQSNSWNRKLKQINPDDKTLVLPLFLYFDEFEPNNPLGSSSNKKKIGAVYVMLPCMPDYLQSHLSQIYLAMLFFTADKKKLYPNCNCRIFTPLIKQLNNLQNVGIFVNHPQYNKVLIVTALILGDNLGLNQILGFTESFNANFYCRFCRCNKNTTRDLCVQKDEFIRNKINYTQDVNLYNVKLTGIKETCIFNDIENFHVTDNFSVDIMHDILEGVAHYDLLRILKQFIYIDQFFDIKFFNNRISSLDLATSSNKPPEIKEETLLSGTKLRYSASEMCILVFHLNCLVGDMIPRDNKHWNLYLTLREILLILVTRKADESTSKLLESMISDHHDQFKKLFAEDLRPKFHFTTHYPYIMNNIGPLQNISSMRFEAKHQQFKEICRATKSRKKLLYTVCLKNQLKFSYLLLNYNAISEKYSKPIAKPAKSAHTDSDFKDKYKLSENSFLIINSIEFKGVTYKCGLVVTNQYYDDEIPFFLLIENIVQIKNEFIFCCQALDTITFDPHLELFLVKKTNKFGSLFFKELTNKKVYNLINFNNNLSVNNI